MRPYYLHQGDLAEGTAHLRTPLAAGVAILEALRGHTSGLAIPHLAVDLPGGGGKITLQPELRRRAGRAARHALGTARASATCTRTRPTRTCACPYERICYRARASAERAQVGARGSVTRRPAAPAPAGPRWRGAGAHDTR